MKCSIIRIVILVAALLSASASVAGGSKASASGDAAVSANAAGNSTSATKVVAPAKLVDINSASKAELKKLPGIQDAQADKIIAGRPYGSKAWLVTHNIISGVHYEQIKSMIVAAQK